MIIDAAMGEGIVNASHELLNVVIGGSVAWFMALGIFRGVKHHWKMGTASSVAAVAGGILISVIVSHVPGLYERGNQEVEKMPGVNVGHSHAHVDRGW